jgi:hypothetical protein
MVTENGLHFMKHQKLVYIKCNTPHLCGLLNDAVKWSDYMQSNMINMN